MKKKSLIHLIRELVSIGYSHEEAVISAIKERGQDVKEKMPTKKAEKPSKGKKK